MTTDPTHVLIAGASSGIGLAVARMALDRGARVTALGRSRSRLQSALGAASDRLNLLELDVRHEADVVAALESLPAPDHVYVAAGGFVGGSVLDGSVDRFREALDARVWGAVNLVRALAPRMQGPLASFVLTGGVSSDRPVKGAWPTALSTAAAEQLARCFALELAPLRFNALAPGWTDTPMWDDLLGDQKLPTFEAVAAKLPTGRLATAGQAAEAVLFLMDNPAVNGEVLHLDGGHRLV